MARHAMSVYDKAIDAVEKSEQMAIFNIYLQKAAEIYGVTRTRYVVICQDVNFMFVTTDSPCRQIYEKAIEVLSDREASIMCQRFAELETKLGEIDRARAIYAHCSQMCDPRVTSDFWQSWKDFEAS